MQRRLAQAHSGSPQPDGPHRDGQVAHALGIGVGVTEAEPFPFGKGPDPGGLGRSCHTGALNDQWQLR